MYHMSYQCSYLQIYRSQFDTQYTYALRNPRSIHILHLNMKRRLNQKGHTHMLNKMTIIYHASIFKSNKHLIRLFLGLPIWTSKLDYMHHRINLTKAIISRLIILRFTTITGITGVSGVAGTSTIFLTCTGGWSSRITSTF